LVLRIEGEGEGEKQRVLRRERLKKTETERRFWRSEK
jgi:hypothetical protein